MKVAAIDLGSNTFLCLIAEVSKSAIIKVYSDTVETVRLGQGLDKTKKFHPEALQRAESSLKKFSEIIKEHRPEKIMAVATAAAREAVNKEELFAIAKKYNLPLEIISGDIEAAITYQGAISGFNTKDQNLMVIDIGGGSTEIIFGREKNLLKGQSLNIGCVSLTEKFITSQPTGDLEIQKLYEFIDFDIKKAKTIMPVDFSLDQIIAVAGTPTSLAAAELGYFNPDKIDGYILTEEKLEIWLKNFKISTIEEKITMGIPKGRADVILVGSIILLRTLKLFGLKQIVVSTRGVRYGVALEMGHRFLSGN